MGLRVLTINQLGYDTTNNLFYIKNVPSPTSTTSSGGATLTPNAANKVKGSS